MLGRGRFVVFYLACGVAAAIAQVGVSALGADPAALVVPMVGASRYEQCVCHEHATTGMLPTRPGNSQHAETWALFSCAPAADLHTPVPTAPHTPAECDILVTVCRE